MKLLCGDQPRSVEVREAAGGVEAVVDGIALAFDEIRALGPSTFLLRRGEAREVFHCARDGDSVHLFWRGRAYRFEEETEAVRAAHRHVGGGLEAPMPGKVIKVGVTTGQEVKKGDELVVVEAMKMENAIRAPRDGRVAAVRAQVGDIVGQGVVLVELE